MIWDSVIWKQELARDLRRMRRRLQQFEPLDSEDAFERFSVALDRFIFTSAFIVRKLSEAHKLSDELEATPLPVSRYPRIDPDYPIHFMNWRRLEQFYDLETHERVEILPGRLCNLLIHSFVFLPTMDEHEESFETILFNSDHTRDQCLFNELGDFL